MLVNSGCAVQGIGANCHGMKEQDMSRR